MYMILVESAPVLRLMNTVLSIKNMDFIKYVLYFATHKLQ